MWVEHTACFFTQCHRRDYLISDWSKRVIKDVHRQHIIPLNSMSSSSSRKTILVTGGSGLVGKAIKDIISTEVPGSRFGKHEGETWIFASSKDGDLRYVRLTLYSSDEDLFGG